MLYPPCYILMTAHFLLTVPRAPVSLALVHRCLLRLWLPPGDAFSTLFPPFTHDLLRLSQHSDCIDRYRISYVHTRSLFPEGHGRFFLQ